MSPLKATQAREIEKASVTDGEALVVNGVMVSTKPGDTMQAGDYYLSGSLMEQQITGSWFNRVILRRPARTTFRYFDTIVMSCPVCGAAMVVQVEPWVKKRNPLTITAPVTHRPTPTDSHSFSIKDGLIMPA